MELTGPRKLLIQFPAIKLAVYGFETSFRRPKGKLKADYLEFNIY